jgi:hypothetical protein
MKMRLEDFRKADCNLFRLPPVDLSDIREEIDRAIIEAWRNQNSAQGAVDSILGNNKILGTLTEKITESLEFQRKVGAENITQEAKETISVYKDEQKQRLRTVDATIGIEAKDKGKTAYKKTEELLERTRAYDVTQANLEAARARINERIAALGGAKSIEAVLDISDRLITEPCESPEKENLENKTEGKTPASNLGGAKPEVISTNANEGAKVPGNQDYSQKSSQDYSNSTKPVGRGKRIMKKIWSVLNYKIW